MNTAITTILALSIQCISLCFSMQVMASQHPGNLKQSAQEQAILEQTVLKRRYTDDIDTAALSRLYQQPSDYLWLEHNKLSDKAADALDFIATSASHGFDPNDYHRDLLQQLEPTADAHLFDLMLSDGMLKLIRDISVGRLDPAIADPQWSIPRAEFDAVSFLREALSKGDFKSSLQLLIPQSDNYRHIKAAIQRYQGFVNDGGWPKIAATRTLKPGDSHRNIPVIRKRLNIEGYVNTVEAKLLEDVYDDSLVQAVKDFQSHHGIVTDGIIGPETLRTMNVTAAQRLQQINITLERLRWMPNDLGKRYILVNLANYRLSAVEDDKIKLDMRVIIGKTKRQTPSFSSKITDIVQNPHWYVPNKLARKDLLPKQQKNPHYFSRRNFRVYDRVNGQRIELDPETIDWHAISEDHFPYSLVQDPGKQNALGNLKFIMPNPWRIYLHDTPSKSLFNKTARNFSSGCIRVEDPYALADFTLADTHLPPLITGAKLPATRVTLPQPVSVYLVYTTVWHDGDRLMFSPDRYHRDQLMAQYL